MSSQIETLAPAQEEGTYVINLAWLDEDGEAVTPSAATWRLSDRNGTIINGREDVAIGSLSTSNDVVLAGDDLVYGGSAERRFEVRYTYASDLGTLTQRIEYRFFIVNHANS